MASELQVSLPQIAIGCASEDDTDCQETETIESSKGDKQTSQQRIEQESKRNLNAFKELTNANSKQEGRIQLRKFIAICRDKGVMSEEYIHAIIYRYTGGKICRMYRTPLSRHIKESMCKSTKGVFLWERKETHTVQSSS